MNGPFLAVDWGTTNRRAWRVEDGRIAASERDARGVRSGATDYPAEIAGVRERLGDLPVLMAGMVGSTIGWHAVPYVDLPLTVGVLAEGCLRIDARTLIVPGAASRDGGGNVMRGEEVQFLGALAGGGVPGDACLCQPGTHSKWATARGGAIVAFATAMTGELFAMLRGHSILAPDVAGPVVPGPAFERGVRAGAQGDLPRRLFGIRAAALLSVDACRSASDGAAGDGASMLSGLLIGADAGPRVAAGDRVYLVADGELAGLYTAAIRILGGTAIPVDATAAFVAGMSAIWSRA